MTDDILLLLLLSPTPAAVACNEEELSTLSMGPADQLWLYYDRINPKARSSYPPLTPTCTRPISWTLGGGGDQLLAFQSGELERIFFCALMSGKCDRKAVSWCDLISGWTKGTRVDGWMEILSSSRWVIGLSNCTFIGCSTSSFGSPLGMRITV